MVFAWFLLFLVSIAVLVYSADLFVHAAEKVALSLGVSSFIVGVTVVAMGTSLPELVTTVFALTGSSQESLLRFVPLEGIVGSNIANILIVIGISAIIAKKIEVDNKLIESDVPLLCIFTGLFVLFIYPDGLLSFAEGMICFLLFCVFIGYSLSTRHKHSLFSVKKTPTTGKEFFMLLGAIVGIGLGGHFTLISLQEVTGFFGWSDTGVLVLILLALGTSLPEIAVSVQAARKKKFELAIGNVFGSNVFNMFLVGGVGTLFGSLPASAAVMSIGIPFLVLATLSFLFTAQDDHIGYWE